MGAVSSISRRLLLALSAVLLLAPAAQAATITITGDDPAFYFGHEGDQLAECRSGFRLHRGMEVTDKEQEENGRRRIFIYGCRGWVLVTETSLAAESSDEAEPQTMSEEDLIPLYDSSFNLARNLYDEGNYEEAARLFRQLAESGDHMGQIWLAYLYEGGQGVEKDLDKALELYERASAQDDTYALIKIGDFKRRGTVGEPDYKGAMQAYQRAADLGNAGGDLAIGGMYRKGQGVERDDAEGLRHYLLAADAGMAEAQFSAGRLYEEGIGTAADPVEAARYFALAAEQDHARGLYELGYLYERGLGVEKDYQQAFELYQRASEQNHMGSQSALGLFYQRGLGVDRDIATAIDWYSKAAEQGDAFGQEMLGAIYLNGDGVPQDGAEAVRWLTLAADQGRGAAQNDLATAYRAGIGVPIDLSKAMELYQLAASSPTASVANEAKAGLAALTGQGANNKNVELPACVLPQIADVTTDQVRVALVVGNSTYDYIKGLLNPRCDAEAMRELLSKAGFDVVYGTNLSKPQFDQKVAEFAAKAAQADVALFYYAGHAIERDGINYLVPTDAQATSDDALKPTLLDVDTVISLMGAGEQVGIVLLDACRNDPFEVPAESRGDLEPSGGLAEIRSSGNLLIGFATAAREVALDGAGMPHSPFTTALLEQMPKPGLDIELTLRNVRFQVLELTKNQKIQQRPWTNTGLASVFYLVPAS